MINSNLIDLLGRLDSRQKKRFLDFIDSPYFNSHSKTAELGHYLLEEIPSFTPKSLEKENIFQSLFPQETYDEAFFSNLMSQLLKLAYRFLGEERQLTASAASFHHQMMALIEMDAPGHARRIEKRYRKKLEDLPSRSYGACREQIDYFEALDQVYVAEASRGYDLNLEAKNRALDHFFLSYKLRIACDMLSRNQIINTSYFPTFLSFLLKNVEKILNEEKEIPAYFIYFLAYQLLERPEEEKHFSRFIAFLYQHKEGFPEEELWVLYNYGLNHCIRKINSGHARYYDELHRLYRRMLTDGVLLKRGYLTQWDFKNIVTVGLRIRDFAWTEGFIHEYQSALHPGERENALIYNLASLHFARGEYEKALRQLHQVEFTDPAYHLGAKIIQIKSYFELNEGEALFALIEAFRKYVRRNHSLGSYKKLANLNFLQLTKSLYELFKKRKRIKKEEFEKEREQLLLKIEQTEPLANKDWLLEKSKG